jgi:LuxR family quorum sensing-dependent transcriptional regulator
MSRKALDETLEFIRNVERAQTPADVCGAMLDSIKQYGFKNILAGTIPIPGSSKPQQESHVILHDWPAGWWERYFSSGYLFVDPAIRRVTTDISPFLWSELSPLCHDNPMASRVMNEAGDFQLKTGFTVPLVTLEGDVAGFSIAGDRLELPPYARGMLSLLATYALGRTLKLQINKDEAIRIGLTPREKEVMQWAAEGKTEWEIGEILHISEHTVDKFFRNARRKLNATNRNQAIAEAFRLNIIC